MIAILLLIKILGVSKQFLLNIFVRLQPIDLCASGKKTSRKFVPLNTFCCEDASEQETSLCEIGPGTQWMGI